MSYDFKWSVHSIDTYAYTESNRFNPSYSFKFEVGDLHNTSENGKH